MSELLLEIGTEEIPAAFMPGALDALKDLMAGELKAARIAFDTIETCGTPRRLILIADGIAESQSELVTKKTGPATGIAYDADGNPTKAALGFARGQGIDVGKLTTITTDKGDYICAEKKETGQPTAALLPEMLPRIITTLPFPKSMRWKDLDLRFARPIHWLVALLDGTVVPFSIGNVASGSATRGHRFMAPETVQVDSAAAFRAALQQGHVMIDPAERRTAITKAINDLAATVGGTPDADEALLTEVTYILESPFPVLCSFEKEFLELPSAVLLTTMKKHQKYFPVLDGSGAPLPHFIAVNNTNPLNPDVVKKGHERVLRARLSDARFFFSEDTKKPLTDMARELKQVVFQAKLGTSHEKVIRFAQLAGAMTVMLGKPALRPAVEQAAALCKADLTSEMVGEFPELQGIMGREYALKCGEPAEVADAILEHYRPRFAGDELPASDIGAIVSLADKLDTIVGIFGIGKNPSGTADPYALRRQCLGIINIITNKKYQLSLIGLIKQAIALLGEKLTRPCNEVYADVMAFFSGRLSNLLTGQGYPHDVVDAVLSLGLDDLHDMLNRIDALRRMKQDPNFEALAGAF
ncbi:MAG: glycine--tRNA ligase subunit beta, partial [Deltaproteobacteria bacterium]|nr:glycine--tRNA ligase subunit beta [Deltaproteobacteria bacterium]